MSTPKQTYLNRKLVDAVLRDEIVGCRAALQAGADPNYHAGTQSMLTSLASSNTRDTIPMIRLLHAHGAKLDDPEPRMGMTPLMEAFSLYNPDVALELVRLGANFLHTDRRGRTLYDLIPKQFGDDHRTLYRELESLYEKRLLRLDLQPRSSGVDPTDLGL